MSFLKTKESGEAQVDFDRLPRHVAIIMDGNGRWAKRRGLPRTAELEAPAGGGFRHRGSAEKVSAGVHRKDGEGQN